MKFETFIVGAHVFIGDYYNFVECKYCGFVFYNYCKEYNDKIIEMIKCLSEDEKLIKGIIE